MKINVTGSTQSK